MQRVSCSRSAIALTWSLLTFAAISSQAQAALPITPPTPVNSYAGSDTNQDQAPGIATDGHGRWIAVWDTNGSLGGTITPDGDIIYSISTDNGATWSAAAALNSDAASDSTNDFSPIIASDGNGQWVAIWHRDPGGYHLRYAASSDNGATWSAAANLTPFHGNDDEFPQLAADGNGNWIAVWDSTHSINGMTGGDGDIHYAVSTDHGNTWSAAAALNTTAATDGNNARDTTPTIATDRQGHWVVTWAFRDFSGGGALGNDFDILCAVSSNNGATWSAPAVLNAEAATDTSAENSPVVATDRWGHWMVVWQSNNSLGGTIGTDDDLLFATSTDNGVTWSTAAPVNSDAATDSISDGNPILTADGDGHWVVIWSSIGRSLGTDEDLLYAVSSDVGATWTAPAAFNTIAATDTGSDRTPTLATDNRGHWVGCWDSGDSLGGTIGTDQDIVAATLIFPDCNSNGTADSDDIAGASDDCDTDGVPDECETDSDGDGVIDDCDGCPSDPAKSVAGSCGCGNPETDTDGDGTPDCVDGCPNDPAKSAAGACGCGTADMDSDEDGIADCIDNCPAVANADQADSDGDGVGDACGTAMPFSDGACGVGACGVGTCGGGLSVALPLTLLQLVIVRRRSKGRRRVD